MAELLFPEIDHIIERIFMIHNKRGELVPFVLNNVQKNLHDNRALRNDILKFRQGGITTFIMAWFLIECMSRFARVVMIAHDKPHTERLLARARLMLQLMRGPKPVTSKLNEEEIVFPKTHASFFIGTAGSKTFGRSDTITHLHCSEFAFWPDPQLLLTGLFQAVPHETGVIVKETTANGFGTYHHSQYIAAQNSLSRFKAFFYPWNIFDEYRSKTPLNSSITPEENELIKRFNLTDSQIQWRREKLAEEFNNDLDLFRQEYPLTVEESFRTSGGSLFQSAQLTKSSNWLRQSPAPLNSGVFFVLNGHPHKDYTYTIGADVSGGTGNDYSAAQIICVETSEQVGMYRTNTLPPPNFATVLAQIGKAFNNAFLVPESNQHGLSVIACLRDTPPYDDLPHKIYRQRARTPSQNRLTAIQNWGFTQTAKTKYQLIGLLQQTLPSLKLYCPITVTELQGFGELEGGKLGALSESSHDDTVIALALACEGMIREGLLYQPHMSPLKAKGATIVDLEDIRQRLTRKSADEIFRSQLVAR